MDFPTIESLRVGAFELPTDQPESDGTLRWDSTTIIVVEIHAGDQQGVGYTYADASITRLVADKLWPCLEGRDSSAVGEAIVVMLRETRNLGTKGLVQMAISAVDVALWDLKARLLDVSLGRLLGAVRERVEIYGSGGFTSYTLERLADQLRGWVDDGIRHVKMKVGRESGHDLERVATARRSIGPRTELFVDANGAYSGKQALAMAERFAEQGVSWFEEPVSSDDRAGLRLLRDRGPVGMDITAGEYASDLFDFRLLVEDRCVDVLMADGTRCGGVTGLARVAALCDAHALPLSLHTAPTLHGHVGAALRPLRHVEYFYDHARLEQRWFDGALEPQDGALVPDLSRPGLGLEFKWSDAAEFAAGQVLEAGGTHA